MNRLVIIGNGFDLAHGLPTSYRNFIDNFWANIKENYKSEDIKKLVEINEKYYGFMENEPITRYMDFQENLETYCETYKYRFNSHDGSRDDSINSGLIFRFENDFFRQINILNSENWVDIENQYYKMLKKIVKTESLNTLMSENSWKKEKEKQILKLNQEFEQVKNLLEKYLFEEVSKKYDLSFKSVEANKDFDKFKDILKPISLFSNEHELLLEFKSEDHQEIAKQLDREKTYQVNESKIYCLNFNYTSTVSRYLTDVKDKIEINSIHGILNNTSDNKINFGFGDEMDEDYKIIENIDDNEFLKNFKSFQYLQNSNYKNLLDFIDTEKFQVYIMGHSCGLSDRTLLNTVFEHNNCRSIKVFYHQRGNNDNYTEIVQNISRHFNKKKLMREKIVNKTLCKPLPQIQLAKIDR